MEREKTRRKLQPVSKSGWKMYADSVRGTNRDEFIALFFFFFQRPSSPHGTSLQEVTNRREILSHTSVIEYM